MKRLTTEANNSHTALEKMSVLGETLQSAGDKISGVGQKLLPVTAGVTALGTIAVKTGADFDGFHAHYQGYQIRCTMPP